MRDDRVVIYGVVSLSILFAGLGFFTDVFKSPHSNSSIAPISDVSKETNLPDPSFDAPTLEYSIPLISEAGVFSVPVRINNSRQLSFVVDSGASDVVISSDIFETLYRSGRISDGDFTGYQDYQIADGSIVRARTFQIRRLSVGPVTVRNVQGSVVPSAGLLLLGQSFLAKLSGWRIDNDGRTLYLKY